MRKTQAGFKDGAGEVAPDLLIRLGPTLKVDIGFEPGQPGGQEPDLPLKGVLALIDTGAGDSCIDSRIAGRLMLPVVDRRVCSGATGITRVNVHLGQIYIPSLKHLLFQQFAAVELEAGGQWHQALLGRTFLRPFEMHYDGPAGQVTISEPSTP